MIQISINGAAREFAESLSVSQLIVELELTGKRIAIERNGEIVPKSEHASTQLLDGDVLEMVVAVGGG
ncbi:sulfur carrier protein ThiS [Chitinibacter sp. FCG-7]|uniref:Sulfur carrier protein ThiS n=1 Tax=Chitinibacter mangrovi TaxID=3153927 RepID=A0AAU7FA12_9NEIS|nr:sulfur carrier protein ThiS [Chitinibacter sp. GC72]